MKCSKCGEKCRNNQAFCIKCGSPVQVVPDFNLIEAELASNIGELLNEDKQTGKRKKYEAHVNLAKINEDDESDILEGQEEEPYIDNEGQAEGFELENKKTKKKKIIIGLAAGAAAILIITSVILIFTVFNGDSRNSFESCYNKGMELYEEGNYDSALTWLLKADVAAVTNEEKIKAKEALWGTYDKIGGKDNEIIEVLKQLVELNSKEVSYYEALVLLYLDKGMDDEAMELINSIEDDEIYSTISAYGVTAPSADPVSGDYDKYFTVALSSQNASSIYYTLDGSEPTKESTLYEGPVEINTEGMTVLRAVAVNDKEMVSRVFAAEYTIKLSELPVPAVFPDSGEYSVVSKITVTAEEGSKIYYTWDGSEPTENATLYSGPIDMPRGNNVFKVIAINGNGVKSAVVTNIYNLQIPGVYSVNEGLQILKNSFVQSGKMFDTGGTTYNGYKYTFKYIETAILENNEYYIIKTNYKDSSDNLKNTDYYGVDSVSGNIKQVASDENGNYSIKN